MPVLFQTRPFWRSEVVSGCRCRLTSGSMLHSPIPVCDFWILLQRSLPMRAVCRGIFTATLLIK